ncbi:MAG: phenylalanine--tRNA ligase subunit beta [Deltaproteobacteria bacterium RIFCSPLOWO2_12_FULL_40_28]|nr:MAG: phenylalanine--tRNA ligase subunit beta [Deltaproteobacteria bacterium RIFCSPHIGHO2_02_FULL_40_28]OGQ21000.1 MAG: phenylalanine--tRNA ligase subunit beta [Deltaproteobacteria bacterium RIFCSPHIGHO2_12_FULL_40_32]OGQ39401.1 MAG: phenylalanine--tRNA ligase subunit beta [Deltaproteobacteria bacterium RIFCSPLOWO2_02_FULL_40_36]OGQ54682.1 MAG: phenylalanine--tRNA ligase subunit beta [Deltaproteobacteria bacterium RIFCSPLOWO2_12_FULL_40_28]
MKISYSWLKEILPGLKAHPQALGERLTNAGIEVEAVTNLADSYKNIVVGEVVELNRHPNAEKLSVCKVSTGKEVFQIVCGASNVLLHGKYPLAKISAKLPNGMVIATAKLRGIDSYGMLCSASELGLEGEKGLLELPSHVKPGEEFAKVYGFHDTILEISPTPNRGDVLSHFGLAREIAILYGLPLKTKDIKLKKESKISPLKVRIENKKGCYRYAARVILGVQIAPSPLVLQRRLENLGLRSINNVVDATNLILLEWGHPVHAFDLDKIEGSQMIIRHAKDNASFKTLDGVERKLESNDLVVADAVKPLALAGIMGGEDSEVTNATKNIVLEVAAFSESSIRQTSRRLGILTESSYRFARGVSASQVDLVMEHLTELILELAGGNAYSKIDLYPVCQKPISLSFRKARLEKILGTSFSSSHVLSLFRGLGFNPKKNKTGFRVTIPPHRFDLTREIDLIEEVVRFTGFDALPSRLPFFEARPIYRDAGLVFSQKAAEFWKAQGFRETIHYSFIDPAFLSQLGLAGGLKLTNPLSSELSVLRPTLLASLLQGYLSLAPRYGSDLRLFEVRKIFNERGEEKLTLAGLYSGKKDMDNWQHTSDKLGFYEGKGWLESFLNFLGVQGVWKPAQMPLYHPGESLALYNEAGVSVGHLGLLHPHIQTALKLGNSPYIFEIEASPILKNINKNLLKYNKITQFPKVIRDLSLVASTALSYQEILDEIKRQNPSWLVDLNLTDLFSGGNLADGKHSLTMSLTYQNNERTLTDEEVNRVHFDLVEKLTKSLAVELR